MTSLNRERVQIASAPTCFGIQRAIPAGAWKPDPVDILNIVAELGYEGIQLGPPGYLGDASEMRSRLSSRGLRLADAFLPFHFSRDDLFPAERAGLPTTLALLSDATTPDTRPVAVLADGFGEPLRWGNAGRIPEHPEAWLPPERFPLLIDNLHRIAEDCRRAGFEPVVHHHAGTYIESNDEIRRVLDALDSSLVGLCLDTGHAAFGGADPVQLASDYRELLRHVHLKDVSRAVIAEGHAKNMDFMALTVAGAFCPLGEGDAGISEVLGVLGTAQYQGWIVVEQDRFLFEGDRLEDVVAIQRDNRAFLERFLSSSGSHVGVGSGR